jgi:SAM-dependent methyltransferase
MTNDLNLRTYESSDVVAFYEKQAQLQPCEEYLFAKYVPRGAAILDMGVGGGRTTGHLAAQASRYVGADYSQSMVDACSRRFPGLEFRHCDATDMSQFASATFDVVVFSFNGIDYINDDGARARCLSEVGRVLTPGGIFIFSSHNARQLVLWPTLAAAKPHQFAWRVLRSAGKSLGVALRSLRGGTFTRGDGYVIDPVHGGIRTYVSTPATVRPQLDRAGLKLREVVRGPEPTLPADFATSWHYYACEKTA